MFHSKITSAGGGHRLPPPPRKFHSRKLDYLERLYRQGLIRTTDDLIAKAEAVDASGRLAEIARQHADQELPLALESLRLQAKIDAAKRDKALLDSVGDEPVAILGDVPPHLLDFCRQFSCLAVLNPEDEHLPHHLADARDIPHCNDFHSCKLWIEKARLVVFDAYQATKVLARPAVHSLLDLRVIRADADLIYHARPLPHPRDEPLSAQVMERLQEY